MQVSCQFSLCSLGVADLGPGVSAAVSVLTRSGLIVETGAMSSVVSGPVDEAFSGLADAFKAAADGGLVLVATVSNACPVG